LWLQIEGELTGSRATYVQWRWENRDVNRNYILGTDKPFNNGVIEAIVGSGPCESQRHRVSLTVRGHIPGHYKYVAINQITRDPHIESPTVLVEGKWFLN